MHTTWSAQLHPAEGAKGFLVMPDGDVFAARTEARADGVFVLLSRSRDGGRTWERVATIVSDPDPGTDLGDGNLCRTRRGELFYVYRHHHHSGKKPYYSVKVARSADGGKTWKPHSTVFEVRSEGEGPSRGLWAPFLFETRRAAVLLRRRIHPMAGWLQRASVGADAHMEPSHPTMGEPGNRQPRT